MKTTLCLVGTLLLSACQVTVVQPQLATRPQVAAQQESAQLYLECGNEQAALRAVGQLTLAQLRDPSRTVRFAADLPKRCRAGNVDRNGKVQSIQRAVTLDGYVVTIVRHQQSNGAEIVYIDPWTRVVRDRNSRFY